MSRYTETSYSGQWEHTRQALSPHHYQLDTMWSILLCCPPWSNGAYSLHCSLSVNRMEALGTTGLMAWRLPLQSQSCQTKILFHGLLTIHVHNYNISILWHYNFCCNFSQLSQKIICQLLPRLKCTSSTWWPSWILHFEFTGAFAM